MDTPTAVEAPSTKLAVPHNDPFYVGRILIPGDGEYAIIRAPKAFGFHAPTRWNKNVKPVEGARSFYDGLANTRAMAEAGSELAAWALGLVIDGVSGFHLPSRDEVNLVYRKHKPTAAKNFCLSGDNPSSIPVGYAFSPDDPAQAALEMFQQGGSEALEPDLCWTSTEYQGGSGYAWCQYFNGGNQDYCRKDGKLRAFAVRRLKI